jgi:hypothetical protein
VHNNILYCDVLPGIASNNLWVLDFMLGLLNIHQAEFTINYYSLNLCTTVHIQLCNHTWNLHRLTSCILLLLLFTIRCLAWMLLAESLIHFSSGTSCVPLYSHSLDSNGNWLHTRYITTPTTQKTSPPPFLTPVYWVIA